MSLKIKLPTFESKSYERYRVELEAWREVTELPKEKQGIAIALSLPDESESNIREKIFDELPVSTLKAEDGFESVLQFFDKLLKKDDLADLWQKFDDFEEVRREQNQSISEYIAKFDHVYKKLSKHSIKLPSEILAFKLLKNANIKGDERLLVLTGLDYSRKETLYEQAQMSLKKFQGDQAVKDRQCGAVKFDAAFLAENEEVLLAAGYVKKSSAPWKKSGSSKFGGKKGSHDSAESQKGNKERPMNPRNGDGKLLTCISCGSFRHLIADCPYSWENMQKSRNCENECLFTGGLKSELGVLRHEALHAAVLDSACSSTVCGEAWLDHYVKSLTPEQQSQLERQHSEKLFRFGGGEILKSLFAIEIPAVIAGNNVTVKTDVVSSDIPLLLSLDAMKKAQLKLDLVNDCAEVFGKRVSLDHTSSGHYCLPIGKQQIEVGEVFAVDLLSLDDKTLRSELLKLHRQFAHPTVEKLMMLLKDAKVWDDRFLTFLQEISVRCELCKVHSKTPSRPVVCLPLAHDFNDKVAMDLKKWNSKWILHLIDMWSRLTVSVFIERKRPTDVIDKIMLNWVGAGFGIMKAVLTDNGGEFCSEEMREVTSILNVEKLTTAAESPFQNGLCERVHSVTDSMLLKLIEQFPKTPLPVLLAWANVARNSLQMWHGFSSYQLVLGRNPNLPNILSAEPPALEGVTTSEALAQHLNALHAAREAFVQSESSERIRRALRHKIRAAEEKYDNGDTVYYKREGHERWLDPAKVMFQDGKVIFLRHGSAFVRVSPTRLIRTDYILTDDDGSPVVASQADDHSQKALAPAEDVVEEVLPRGSCSLSTTDNPNESANTSENSVVSNEVESSEFSPEASGESVGNKAQTSLISSLPKKNDVIALNCGGDRGWSTVCVLGRAGKACGKNQNWLNVQDPLSDKSWSVDFTNAEWCPAEPHTVVEDVNVVHVPKALRNSPECLAAKMEELAKLKSFDTYSEVPYTNQSVISTTWVLWVKDKCIRARLVARGFEEHGLESPTDSPTVSKSALRTFLSVSSMNQWPVQSMDIKSAFLQGKRLHRDVYVQPPPESNVGDGVVWKLHHCLYGLNDAARQFYESVVEQLMKSGCIRSSLDPAVFRFCCDGILHGLFVCHVDDFLYAGD